MGITWDLWDETNSKFAPENGWFPSTESPGFQGAPIFRGYVSFRQYIRLYFLSLVLFFVDMFSRFI